MLWVISLIFFIPLKPPVKVILYLHRMTVPICTVCLQVVEIGDTQWQQYK